jgi:hypothetical protein
MTPGVGLEPNPHALGVIAIYKIEVFFNLERQ